MSLIPIANKVLSNTDFLMFKGNENRIILNEIVHKNYIQGKGCDILNDMLNTNEKNELKKMLPIVTPPMRYSLFVADKLSIIMQHRDAVNWLLNNFIQLVFYTDNLKEIDFRTHYLTIWPADTFKLDQHGTNLFLRETTINDTIMDINENNLMDCVKKWINQGLYIYANIDVSKLKNTKYYGDTPFCHSSLVYGYDEENVYQLDFNQNEAFGTLTIPYEDYKSAFLSKDLGKMLQEQKKMNVKYNLTLIKVKEEYGSFCELDKNVMRYWIKAYLDSDKSKMASNPFFNNYAIECGLNIYGCVKEMILKMTKDELLDYRMFHALYEHKKVMVLRVETLMEKGLLNDEGTLLENSKNMLELAHELRNLSLKYTITHSTVIVDKVLDKLNVLKESDEIFMTKLYKALS